MSIEKLKQVSEELNAAKAKIQEFAKNEGRAAIGAAFAKCFEPPTNLVQICWTQYTPHFNDGDACVFGVNEPTLVFERDGEEVEVEYWYLGSSSESEHAQKQRGVAGPVGLMFSEIWEELEDDILEAVFGDHAEVTITKDEVTVTEYDHD